MRRGSEACNDTSVRTEPEVRAEVVAGAQVEAQRLPLSTDGAARNHTLQP